MNSSDRRKYRHFFGALVAGVCCWIALGLLTLAVLQAIS